MSTQKKGGFRIPGHLKSAKYEGKAKKIKEQLVHKAQVKKQFYKSLPQDDTPDYVKEIFGEKTIDEGGNVVEYTRKRERHEEEDDKTSDEQNSEMESKADKAKSKKIRSDAKHPVQKIEKAKPNPYKHAQEQQALQKEAKQKEHEEVLAKIAEEQRARKKYFDRRRKTSNKVRKKTKKDGSKTTQHVVLAFWTVVLFAVPFWWKTTEIHRASLPFNDISSWAHGDFCPLVFPFHFSLHVDADSLPELARPVQREALVNDVETLVKRSWQEATANSCVKYSVKLDAGKLEDGCETMTQRIMSCADATNKVAKPTEMSHYHVYLRGSHSDQNNPTAMVSADRIMEIRLMQDAKAPETVANLLIGILDKQVRHLGAIIDRHANEKVSAESMRVMKYSSNYQLTFSLMNADPSAVKVGWDIHAAVEDYLSPFLSELAILSNFTVDSQVQHYAELTFKPKFRLREKLPSYHYLEPDTLPHFINAAEWNLGNAVSTKPTINFLLYVPSAEYIPLRLHNSKGEPVNSNAFLLPRWGGIAISNPNETALENGQHFYDRDALQPIMELYLRQLRLLMGIADPETVQMIDGVTVTYESAPVTGITMMEKDALIKRRMLENIASAISTLDSLMRLLKEIPNMVVLDHIQIDVTSALQSLANAKAALHQAEYAEALHHSIQALKKAETAFFDPTMVSMLYFPDEHKYAIYMPLFVPISVPLFSAVLKEIKNRRKAP